jgi:hypothetical protein
VSRNRTAVVVGVLVVFIVVGGILFYARSGGGQNVTFDVTVTGGKTIKPSDLTVNKNDTVTINITSDMDGEVHLHVYDIHFETKKGQTVSQMFKADRSGTFPIEWESTSAELGRLTVNP